MSNRLVAIVGGAIATVVGGLILFYILPSQQAPGLPSATVAPSAPSIARTGAKHLKCTMRGGPMAGRIYSFSIDVMRKEAAWTDYGIALKIGGLDEQRIFTTAKTQLHYGRWPEHDHILFEFNRLTMSEAGWPVRSRRSIVRASNRTVAVIGC